MSHDRKINDRIRRAMLVWSIVLGVMVAIVAGEAGTDTEESYISEETEVTDVNATSVDDANILQGGTIQSITFKKDMRITDALRFLALKYNKNIVPSPKVDGQLGFTSLFNVTFEEAMAAILGGNFEYEQKGNLIEAFPKGDKSRMKHEVFALHYISAAEAKQLIEPILSGEGKVGTTTPAETGVAADVSIGKAKGGDTMSLQDTIVIYDYAENIKRARKLISDIDVKPTQILIEATIMSATLTENTQLGVDWNLLGGVSLNGTDATTDLVSSGTISRGTAASKPIKQVAAGAYAGTPIETSGFAAMGGSGLRIGITSGDVSAFITALEATTDVTILANPKILAVNKQQGQVFIGTKVKYKTLTQNQTSTIENVESLDTGTKLSFRPYIGKDGYIRMDIHSKDSTFTINNQNLPDETSAEVLSNILVKDGETIVIGGLFRDEVTTTKTQIPILGDIPILGALFRGTGDKVVRKEVMVLLTPHIINEPAETNGDARIADVERKQQGAREGEQWVGRARLAEDRYAKASSYYLEGNYKAAMKELKVSLELRPTYLEALRLKERIISETDPNSVSKFERNVLDTVEQKDSEKWRRR